MRGLVQVLGLVLELVDVLAALGDGFEVLLHHIDCVVDLLERKRKVRKLTFLVWHFWGSLGGKGDEGL